MGIIKNAWEVVTDEHALLALAGDSTREEFERDREERVREVIEWCSIDVHRRGFEVGSGEGTVARLLSSNCLWLDCNDISASFLERARNNCGACKNVAFHKIDSDYLDYLPSESYDFGFSLNVFIHLNSYDIFHYLRSAQRILKAGGYFYFDACTIGEQTIALFREHADTYRRSPEAVRGLLNFNHPNFLSAIVREAGLTVSDRSYLSETGWLKVLTIKP